MLRTQKLPNSQWVAHDVRTSDLLPKTLRSGLRDAKVAYIEQHLVTSELRMLLTLESVGKNLNDFQREESLLNRLEDQIPEHIGFVTVTLIPRWETEI